MNNTSQQCIGINGLPLAVDGIVQANLTFPDNGDFVYAGKFLISNNLFSPLECVLGWDFLTSNGLALTREHNGVYVLVGCHGRTPLTPKDRDSVCPSQPPQPDWTSKINELDNRNVSGVFNVQCFSQCTSKSPVPISLCNSVCLPGRTEAVICPQIPKSFADQ